VINLRGNVYGFEEKKFKFKGKAPDFRSIGIGWIWRGTLLDLRPKN
jgi:hypothetical protein